MPNKTLISEPVGSRKNQVGSEGPLTVYYDGECPVCRMEVGYYRRIDAAGAIAWSDIALLRDDELPKDKSRRELLGIFHAWRADGGWATGVDAFAEIWSRLPRFWRFAWVFRTPVMRQVAQLFYRGFLAWQRRDRARRQRISEKSHVASG